MEGERLHIIIKEEKIKDELQKKKIDKKVKCSYKSFIVYLENRYSKIPVSIIIETNYNISKYKNLYIFPYKTEYGKKLGITLKRNIIKEYLKTNKDNYAMTSNCESMRKLLKEIGFTHSGTIYENLYYINASNII